MWDLINKSKRKSLILLVIFLFVSLFFISAIGIYLMYSFGTLLGAIFIFFSSIYVIYKSIRAYYKSHEIALSAVNAIPIEKAKLSPQVKQYIKDTVEALAIAGGIPAPKVYIMKSEMINAFATGPDPRNSYICLTTGAIKKLNREELEGVIGHEMGHILNGDIRYMTFASVLLAFLVTLGNIGFRFTFFGDRRRGGVILLIGFLLSLLAPLFGKILQAAISRQREFLADATSARLTRNPNELISALKKIKTENEKMMVRIPSEVMALMIWEPRSLFSTHPPIDERIKKLEEILR